MKPFWRFVHTCRGFAIDGTARAELMCTCVASVRVQMLVACICRSACTVANACHCILNHHQCAIGLTFCPLFSLCEVRTLQAATNWLPFFMYLPLLVTPQGVQHVPPCTCLLLVLVFYNSVELYNLWDFSLGKFGLLFPGKASCDSHTTQPTVHTGCFSVPYGSQDKHARSWCLKCG